MDHVEHKEACAQATLTLQQRYVDGVLYGRVACQTCGSSAEPFPAKDLEQHWEVTTPPQLMTISHAG